MTDSGELYKCEICGIVASVVESGGGTLVCCGNDMVKFEPKGLDQEGKEKHVPVLKSEGNQVTVNVGSIEHPMEEKHYIELIQLVKNDKVIAEKRLSPGEKPEAVFIVDDSTGLSARELCTLHGLWNS